MDKIYKALGLIVMTIFLIFVACIFSGSILWLLYPHIHSLFPTAAENGVIALDLSWWDSVCINWIFAILFKGSISTNKK